MKQRRTSSRFIFPIGLKAMKFKGFKYNENPFRGIIGMQNGGYSQQDLYNFIFDDDEVGDKKNTAPSTKELQEAQEEMLKYQEENFNLKKRMRKQQTLDMAMSTGNLLYDNNLPNTDGPLNVPSQLRNSQGMQQQQPTQRAPKPSGSVQERINFAFNYLQNKHKLPPHVAAGIVGNFRQESDLYTGALGDNDASFGIAQWQKDRRTNLMNWAKQSRRDIYNLETQLDYAIEEGNQRGDLQATMKAKNSRDAAYTWASRFERPKVIDNKRLNYAQQIHPYKEGGDKI